MSTRHPSQRIAQRDRQVFDHLLSISDSEGQLNSSSYAIACELGFHRQTLSRILRRLAKTGMVTLAEHACRPIRVTETVTEGVTEEAGDATAPVTEVPTGAMISWTVTCSLSYQPGYVMGQSKEVTDSPKNVTVSDCNNTVSDDNKETKQKNEEIPPATPKEEKKQNKENSPSPVCARKEISTKADGERLAQRRQRFIDILQPFADRYGQEMIRQFAEYWTETNRSNTRMRFELQRTWNTSLRLAQLFVAKYGTELSVFSVLLYFAQYLTDYKSTYGQFDLVDVLRQCGKLFVPKWRARLGRLREKEAKQSEGFCEVGIAALYTYLRREYVAKGKDIRTSPVVMLSSLTEKDLKFIESDEPMML